MALIGSKLLPPGCVDVRGWSDRLRKDSVCSQGGRPAKCFNVPGAHFPSDPSALHLGMFVLEEASCCLLVHVTSGCEFCCHSHWGWRDRLSTPQVWRLRQRRPRVLRRKRDCTLALFLTFSRWPSYLVSGDFRKGRIGTSTFLLTMPVSTSVEEG